MRRLHTTLLTLPVVACCADALAQPCNLLIRDTFRFGDRPHGGNGAIRTAEMEDHLSGFWPQLPASGLQWITSAGSDPLSWRFASASEDPSEFDPLDVNNGIAYGDPGATALLPFSMPNEPVTISVNVIGPMYVGFTSSPDLDTNFATNGALWLELAYTSSIDQWILHANGSAVIATGFLDGAYGAGVIESGFLNMQLTYDPVAHVVSGHIQNAEIPPTPVNLTLPISYVGFEVPLDRIGGMGLNNFSVFTGPRHNAVAPTSVEVCPGGEVTILANTNDAGSQTARRWHKDSEAGPLMLYDGPQLDGSVLIDTNTNALTISNATSGVAGTYRLFIAGECGMGFGTATTVTVACGTTCDPIDFNNDSLFPDTLDIDDFLTVFSGGACSTGACNDIDFNNDSLFPDTTDIDALLSVFSGGACI